MKIHPLNDYLEKFQMNKYNGTFLWLPNHTNQTFCSSITLAHKSEVIYEKLELNNNNMILTYTLHRNYETLNTIPYELLNLTNEYKANNYKLQPIIPI
jgi:hypothetical protein